ncbi:MAG TPA: DUF3574 domain-containing protein [Bacteroidota bacterium]|nr:DUF3574 domain-containing protein [Bacteroidota bacterium]
MAGRIFLPLRLVLSACAVSVLLISCSGPATMRGSFPAVVDRIYFGRAIGDTATIADSSWRSFADDVLAPSLPNGFTTWKAEGQWRRGDGTVGREDSFVLEIVSRRGEEDMASVLERIIHEYKRRFHQESVLHVRTFGVGKF